MNNKAYCENCAFVELKHISGPWCVWKKRTVSETGWCYDFKQKKEGVEK